MSALSPKVIREFRPGERELWLAIRQALIIIVREIERYVGVESCITTKRDVRHVDKMPSDSPRVLLDTSEFPQRTVPDLAQNP